MSEKGDRLSDKLPPLSAEIIACYYLPKHPDSVADIVVCTNNGQLLEFSQKKIICACAISTCNAESIKTLMLYNPLRIYYIIKSGTDLHIIQKQLGLKIIQELKNVGNYMVKDFWEVGYAQLGVWLNGNGTAIPDVITDFTQGVSDNVSSSVDPVAQIFHENLQGIKARLAEAKDKLKQKIRCRKISQYSWFENQEKIGTHLGSTSQLVCMVGQECTRTDHEQQQRQPRPLILQAKNIWHRVIYKKWILGVCIYNAGCSCVTDAKFLLKDRNGLPLNYTTQILASSNKAANDSELSDPSEEKYISGEWQNVTTIPPNSMAVILGILKQPKFLSSPVLSVSGVVTYQVLNSSGSLFQLQIPRFQLSAEEYSMGPVMPFTQDGKTDMDLLSVLVGSEHVTLSLSNIYFPFRKILETELGFKYVPELGSMFHNGNARPQFLGIMMRIRKIGQEEFHLNIYGSDFHQIFLLIHCLYAVLPMDVKICLPLHKQILVSQRKFYDSLWSEICFVASKFVEWNENFRVTEDIDGQQKCITKIPRDIYFTFQKQLLSLEAHTDTFCSL